MNGTFDEFCLCITRHIPHRMPISTWQQPSNSVSYVEPLQNLTRFSFAFLSFVV